MADKPKMSKSQTSKPKAKASTKTAKVKAVKPAAKTTAIKPTAKTKAMPAADKYFVDHGSLEREIHRAKPAKGTHASEHGTFAAAKEKALDHLIALIEKLERRLHATRRAESYDDYERLHRD